jgi:hypothetical protein
MLALVVAPAVLAAYSAAYRGADKHEHDRLEHLARTATATSAAATARGIVSRIGPNGRRGLDRMVFLCFLGNHFFLLFGFMLYFFPALTISYIL